MRVNFFETKCKSTTNSKLFGLCDDENNSPAYLDFDNSGKWNATVYNSLPTKELDFVAIDNCIEIFRENGQMENRCDCLMAYPDNIIFIELKNKGSNWKSEGINQIEITIKNFCKNYNLTDYKHKRAFVANKRHPSFNVIDIEKKRKFWDKYKVRLNIEAQIRI